MTLALKAMHEDGYRQKAKTGAPVSEFLLSAVPVSNWSTDLCVAAIWAPRRTSRWRLNFPAPVKSRDREGMPKE